ncbi:MAG: heat-inducible transcriptional repressor HrcA [Halofilum sp. (in: g-proteobacteria)]
MSRQSDPNQLPERTRRILHVLVEQYIRGGQPIGSRSLSRVSGLGLSPATVRNIMYDLEEQGYIQSPHTSAGRIPTEQGYRLFVDSLLKMQPVHRMPEDELRKELALDAGAEPKNLIESVSSFLSGFTRMAGVVTLPQRGQNTLRYIEFLDLGQQRILVILVVNDHEVQNQVIHTDRDYSRSDLEQAANYVNHHFAGRDVSEIRQELHRELQATRRDVNRMMDALVDMAGKAFAHEAESDKSDFVLAGETNLMNFEELSDVEKLKALFETFNRKRDLYDLLSRCAHTDGVQIFIGRESGHQVLDDLSIVTAPYGRDGEVVGVLGVIGPTRMEYERVISVVDVTSKLLGAALKSQD